MRLKFRAEEPITFCNGHVQEIVKDGALISTAESVSATINRYHLFVTETTLDSHDEAIVDNAIAFTFALFPVTKFAILCFRSETINGSAARSRLLRNNLTRQDWSLYDVGKICLAAKKLIEYSLVELDFPNLHYLQPSYAICEDQRLREFSSALPTSLLEQYGNSGKFIPHSGFLELLSSLSVSFLYLACDELGRRQAIILTTERISKDLQRVADRVD